VADILFTQLPKMEMRATAKKIAKGIFDEIPMAWKYWHCADL